MVKTKFKQTEIGLIPEDWEERPLEHYFSYISYGFTNPMPTTNCGVWMITANDIKNGKINLSTARKTSTEAYNKLLTSKSKPLEGDVLLTKDGSLGRVAVVGTEKLCINQSIAVIRPNSRILSTYLKYLLSFDYYQDVMIENAGGSTIKHIYITIVNKMNIVVPPPSEQQAIAQTLSDTDTWIESLEKLIDKKKLIKQGAMQNLLTPKEDWDEVMLGDVAKVTRGASPRPIDSPIWFDDKSTVGWVRISDVTKSNKFLNTTVQKLSELGIKASRFVENGSLIMSICATIGKPIITEIDVCIHDGFVVFSDLKLEKDYLYNYLKFIEKDWSKNGQTGSQMNLNTTLINTTSIHFPKCNTEQTRIATILSDMDAEIEALEKKLQKAHQLKQGMMQELLTGRIRLVESVETKQVEPKQIKKHSDNFNDAVLIATMASVFGTHKFPLRRFKYTKVSYLLKRYKEEQDAGYSKYAAGPYKPKTRYGGAEKIAIEKKYVEVVEISYNGKISDGFIPSENTNEAIKYFETWYGADALTWIEQFRFEKNENLELWATVDMAIEDLKKKDEAITISTIKQVLKDDKEWINKLNRNIFSDINIQSAITKLETLFT